MLSFRSIWSSAILCGMALILAVLLVPDAARPQGTQQTPPHLPNNFPFIDPDGILTTHTTDPGRRIDLNGPFFQELGTNGRSCATCHQPSDAWSISAEHVKARFVASRGMDPIFRTVDGANCEQYADVSTLAGREKAYSLLTSRGLIRIFLPVPGNAEFEVVSINNQYGCNDMSNISMYRRPLAAANLRFLSTVMWDGRESSPETGTRTIANGNDLLFDLAHQAVNATVTHAKASSAPTRQQQEAIVNFLKDLYVAQALDFKVGDLDSHGAKGGPVALSAQPFFIGMNDSFPPDFNFNPSGEPFTPNVFTLFDSWGVNRGNDDSRRASIARGQTIFNTIPINLSGVTGLNDILGRGVMLGTCTTCHDSPNAGNHSVSILQNIGTGDLTSPLDISYLPVITVRRKTTGDVIQTTDLGRALVTGLWADVGKVKVPVLRGLAGRAPYFHNGSANTLGDVVDFYDRRFGIGFTAQQKADLLAFLRAL